MISTLLLEHTCFFSVIELACGEYGEDKIGLLTTKAENGRELTWLDEAQSIPTMEELRKQYPLSVMKELDSESGPEETPQSNQRSVLIRRGFLKAKRDPVSFIYSAFKSRTTNALL